MNSMYGYMSAIAMTADQMLKRISDCNKFVAFVTSLSDLRFQEGKVEELFYHITDGNDTLDQGRFNKHLRLFYRVIKPTVLTENLALNSTCVRRLDVGEIA